MLALGMTLPGPTSSEFAFAGTSPSALLPPFKKKRASSLPSTTHSHPDTVGTYRAGVPGALVCFVAWTLPSFIIMLLAGLGATHMDPNNTPDWMSGLAPAATVLIFVAFARLGKKIVGGSPLKACIALASSSITLLVQNDARIPARAIMWILPLMLLVGGSLTLGEKFYKEYRARKQAAAAAAAAENGAATIEAQVVPAGAAPAPTPEDAGSMGSAAVTSDTYDRVPVSKWSSLAAFLLLAGILLYLLAMDVANRPLDPLMHVFSSFFIVGITIYGGGQVMLPLLVSVAVNPGWLSMDQFMVGFAIIQMLPGPLSNLAAYIGAIYMGVPGALVGVLGFFLPGLLLTIAVLPLWDRVRKVPNVRPFLAGVNATGLGLILAVGIALYLHVVRDPADAVVTVVTACLVGYLGHSSLVGVLSGALVGFFLSPTCLDWGQQRYLTPK